MKSFAGVAVFAVIALCALFSSAEANPFVLPTYGSTYSGDGTIDVDADITLTIDLRQATTVIFNTILTLLLPVLLQVGPLLVKFLEAVLF